jgi:hypothetical protein
VQVIPDSLMVRQEISGRHVYIDAATVHNLELLRSDNSSRGSLLGLLNKTVTKGGAQLLKASLLQPVRDIATIDARLDALDEVLRDETLYIALSSLLAKVPKVRSLAACCLPQRLCYSCACSHSGSFACDCTGMLLSFVLRYAPAPDAVLFQFALQKKRDKGAEAQTFSAGACCG